MTQISNYYNSIQTTLVAEYHEWAKDPIQKWNKVASTVEDFINKNAVNLFFFTANTVNFMLTPYMFITGCLLGYMARRLSNYKSKDKRTADNIRYMHVILSGVGAAASIIATTQAPYATLATRLIPTIGGMSFGSNFYAIERSFSNKKQ